MKKPIVFSLVHEQSVFMTAIMSLLTFLSVIALGIAISIGTGVSRWNSQWELFATVQVMKSDNTKAVQETFSKNETKIESITEISKDEMEELMRPWLSETGGALKNYLPQMYEVKFKTKNDLEEVGQELSKYARFLTHSQALKTSMSAGWKMIFISGTVLILTLLAIGVSISYTAKNTALLHRRELEILNQIGASDSFVAHQMQVITTKICALAGLIGFGVASPILLFILSSAHSARVGLMAMLDINVAGWVALALLPIIIIIFAIYITKKTTLKILQNS